MPSYIAVDRETTAAAPVAAAPPQTSDPAPTPRAAAAPDRGPPRVAELSTRTSSGPGVSVRAADRSTNPARPSTTASSRGARPTPPRGAPLPKRTRHPREIRRPRTDRPYSWGRRNTRPPLPVLPVDTPMPPRAAAGSRLGTPGQDRTPAPAGD